MTAPDAIQESLDDYRRALTEAARDVGIFRARGAVAAEPEWWDRTDRAIDQMARSGEEFTADDPAFRFLAEVAPGPGALGAAFRSAAAGGRIRSVGYVRSTRPSRHGAPIAVWVGSP